MATVRLSSLLCALVGALIFTKGFFLHRHELPHHSGCDDVHELLRDDLGLSSASVKVLIDEGLVRSLSDDGECWSPALGAVDEVMLVVVDALRFDFANTRLPKLMSKYPPHKAHTKLYKFVADPPTVTTQR